MLCVRALRKKGLAQPSCSSLRKGCSHRRILLAWGRPFALNAPLRVQASTVTCNSLGSVYCTEPHMPLASLQHMQVTTVTRSGLDSLYWTVPQMLAHHTAGGCNLRPGDLIATGTLSTAVGGRCSLAGAAGSAFWVRGWHVEARLLEVAGATNSERSSSYTVKPTRPATPPALLQGPSGGGALIELTWGGTRPVGLAGGGQRTYLEDGDAIVMRGWCAGPDGSYRVGFGECRGRVLPAAAG